MVLVSIDTLRSDRLPAYGYAGVETPAIDGLRGDAILFERAYSHVPLTLPSHVSMLTGVLPGEHGVRDNGGYSLDVARHPWLPRLLGGAGYETAAFVSSFVLRGESGLREGFDVWDQGSIGTPGAAEERPGAATVRAAIDWLRSRAAAGRGEKPFLLFVHLYDPHAPYRAAEPFASRYRASPYDGEVAAADAAVATLLDELRRSGRYERALVVLTSDHGEGLGDHGEAQHGFFLYREALQVPLLVKLPAGVRAGESVAAPAGLVDVVPTLLAQIGVPVPAEVDGVDLLAPSEPAGPPRRIYAETFYPRLHMGWSELASLVEGRWHYVHGPAPELFDVEADPAERHDVLDQRRREYAALRDALAATMRPLLPPRPVDAETARSLAALGYAAGGRVVSGDLPDPRQRREAIADLEAAKESLSAGRWAETAERLERLLEREPGMLEARVTLAICWTRLGRPEAALEAYRRAFEDSGHDPAYALSVAQQLARMGRVADAARHAELALASAPDAATARQLLDRLVLALVESGENDAASELLGRAVARDPDDVRSHELLGMVELRQARPAQAREHLERAVTLDPRRPEALNTLGVARYQSGDREGALASWRQAIALDAAQHEALLNLGLVAAELGRVAEARAALDRFTATAPPARYGPDIAKARRLLRELGA